MKIEISRIFEKARKSVVIVADERRDFDHCSGFIVDSNADIGRGFRTTLVMASTEFVEGREEHLSVCFFDSEKLHATLIGKSGSFCVLATGVNSGCEAVKFTEDCSHPTLAPSLSFMVVPDSSSTNSRKESYVVLESTESYLEGSNDLLAESEKYFVVACEYYDKTVSGKDSLGFYGRNAFHFRSEFDMERDGLDKLTCAPVFDMSGVTIGVVVRDCRSIGPAAGAMKLAMKATHFRKLLGFLDKPPVPPPPSRRMKCTGSKRKRG